MASTMPVTTVYLAAIDGTPCADRALEIASTLGAALGNGAELHIVHVLPIAPPLSVMGAAPLLSPNDLLVAGRALLDRACADAAVHFKGKISGHLAAGEPWRQIIQTASTLGADLVVVGTEGRTGIARIHNHFAYAVERPLNTNRRIVPPRSASGGRPLRYRTVRAPSPSVSSKSSPSSRA